MGRQAELLRRHRLGQPGRELRAVPLEGPPGRDRRAPRVARVGRDRRLGQAPGRRDRRRERPVPRQPRRRRRRRRRRSSCPPARPARPPTSRRPQPTTTSRSKEDQAWHSRSNEERAVDLAPPPAGRGAGQPRRRNCHFCRDKVEEVDYKNIPSSGRSSRRRGRSARGGSRAPAAGTRCRSGPRSSGRARWHSSPTSPGTDAGHPAGRTSRRSACAARSSTSRAGTPATSCSRGSSPSRHRRRAWPRSRSAPTLRARQEAWTFEQASELAATLEKTELRFDVKAGPTGSLFGSVTPTDLADEIWGKSRRSASTAARSTSASRSRRSADTRCPSSSSPT